MGFTQTRPVVARIVRIIGSAGAKIVGTVDSGGNPFFDFHTDGAEVDPARIWARFPGGFLLSSFTTALFPNPTEINLHPEGIQILGGTEPVDIKSTDKITLGGVVDLGPDANGDRGVQGRTSGIPGTLIGRRIIGFDAGSPSDNAKGGNGTVDFPHNFPAEVAGEVNVFVPIRTGAANSFLARFPAGDTGSTFQCRATIHDGTAPANGTNITCTYVGFRFAP